MRSIPLADHPITSQPTYDKCVLKGSASAALKQRLHRVLAIRGLVCEGRNRSRWDLRPLDAVSGGAALSHLRAVVARAPLKAHTPLVLIDTESIAHQIGTSVSYTHLTLPTIYSV